MECAGKGRGTRCTGRPTRRCARCGAVAYCSVSHQVLHWSEHKEECERLEQQMKRVDELNNFPFNFRQDDTESRCSFLIKRGVHRLGMWACECSCYASFGYSNCLRTMDEGWHLSGDLCPCWGPVSPVSKLRSWMDYYDWRLIPLHSPVAVLLHWPLTIYYATQLVHNKSWTSESCSELRIHYLGPEKELLQLDVFGELRALFPGMKVHVELFGPAIPEHRESQVIDICSYACCLDTDCICKPSSKNVGSSADTDISSKVILHFHRGLYHDRFKDLAKGSFPHLVIAPNAGIAAYLSWLPTIELINKIGVPALFSDYCEEACHLAETCITSVTGRPLTLPIQINPFRQPLAVEGSALHLPCYPNCFLFGI